jgi:hypothetical protein
MLFGQIRSVDSDNNVAHLLKAKSGKLEKRQLLGNICVTHKSGVNVGSVVFNALSAESM